MMNQCFIDITQIYPALKVRDKKQLLKALAVAGSEHSGLSERKIYQALSAREQASCTGMGGGIAIPHARFKELEGVVCIFMQLVEAVEYCAPDKKPVDLVFLLLSAEGDNTKHIKALAGISKLARKRDCADALREAKSPEAILLLLQKGWLDE